MENSFLPFSLYHLPCHIALLICKCTFVFAQVVCPTPLEQDIFAFDLHDPQRINPYGFGYLLTFPLLLLPGQNLHLHTRNQTQELFLSCSPEDESFDLPFF